MPVLRAPENVANLACGKVVVHVPVLVGLGRNVIAGRRHTQAATLRTHCQQVVTEQGLQLPVAVAETRFRTSPANRSHDDHSPRACYFARRRCCRTPAAFPNMLAVPCGNSHRIPVQMLVLPDGVCAGTLPLRMCAQLLDRTTGTYLSPDRMLIRLLQTRFGYAELAPDDLHTLPRCGEGIQFNKQVSSGISRNACVPAE